MENQTKQPLQFENLNRQELIEAKLGGNMPQAPISQADGMLQMAIQQNMPVESLKELVALRNQELARLAKGSFVRAMAKFQSIVPAIHKNNVL